MTNFEFRYQLSEAPEARADGSGLVMHQVTAQARESGSSDPWVTVPGRAKTVEIPNAEITLGLGSGTQAQKIAAYKQAMVDNINTTPIPITGWGTAQMEALLNANESATAAAVLADDFITVTLGLSYPVSFAL